MTEPTVECGVLMPNGVSFTGFRDPRDIPSARVLRLVTWLTVRNYPRVAFAVLVLNLPLRALRK